MDFEVRRRELGITRFVDPPPFALGHGQVVLRVDSFGLTTNNITYGVAGEMLKYWDFFPPQPGDGWGRIPAFGFAEVVASRHQSVAEGTRVFGYLPMSNFLTVDPGRVDGRGFFDGAHHRQAMASAYNHYLNVRSDVSYDPSREPHQMLLRPLFFTSFLIDDFLADGSLLDAGTVVISSASSKTAIGTAFQLARRDGIEVIGLTSATNVGFTESLGVYHHVLPYEHASQAPGDAAVYVDIAGNAAVRNVVHRRYGANLTHSMIVGNTHVGGTGPVSTGLAGTGLAGTDLAGTGLAGPAPQLFFAPAQVAKRAKEWGQPEFDRRVGESWQGFSAWTDSWLAIHHGRGPDAIVTVYQRLLAGEVDPQAGHVMSMWPPARTA